MADLKSAERLLIGTRPLTDIAGFHCQQAAEKVLKAYLTWHEVVFPKTHSLVALIALCLELETKFETLRFAAITLTPYAVASRYPGGLTNLSSEEAAKALVLANQVWKFILARIPDTLSTRFTSG